MVTAILILLLAAALGGLAWALASIQRERRVQLRLMQRMRRDAARQEHAIMRLSEGLNASLRQVNQLSQAVEARQERMRRTLDERVTQMQQAN